MVRKAILAIALVGVLVWTVTCGRSRTPAASDTPVPTLTPAPTITATPSVTATPVPMVSPTEPAAATAIMTASETVTPLAEITESAALTSATEVTPSATITQSENVTVSPELTASATITTSESLTATETPSAPVESTPAQNITASVGTTATATVSETATISASNAITESTPITNAATISEAEASTTTATATPGSTPEAIVAATPESTTTIEGGETVTSTAPLTETSAITGSEAVTGTEVVTASEGVTSTGIITKGSAITTASELTVSTAITPAQESSVREENGVMTPESISRSAELATAVTITGVTLLTDLVADALPAIAELSPDGKWVAWLAPEQARRLATLCVASLRGEGQNCFSAEGFQGMPYRLVWSPDSQWLAFSEDPSAQALESDIWLFDVAQGTVTNRTNEDAAGRFADVEGEFRLDYLPMWDPASGLLYFWRSTPDGQGGFDLDLMQMVPGSDEAPVVVRALAKTLGDGLVRFGWQRFYLQGPSAISPDGAQLAVVIAPAQEMDLATNHALWLIDLVNAKAEPQRVATALDWQAALPQWSNQPAVARGLQWTADGKGIVVAALSSDLRLPLLLAYYVDVASSEVTPVLDFSDSSNRNDFFRLDPTTGHAPRFDVPWTLALAPNANVLLMVTDLAGGMVALGASLPPTGAAPVVLNVHRSPGFEAWTRSSSASDGKMLVYGLLMESVPGE